MTHTCSAFLFYGRSFEITNIITKIHVKTILIHSGLKLIFENSSDNVRNFVQCMTIMLILENLTIIF